MADPVAPIRMVGPPGTLPPELQARAAQVALQQQIAQALLASSMGVESPVVQGPSGNPFARSTINLGPLGKMFQSYRGSQLSGQAAEDQAAIAAAGEQQRLQGLTSAFGPREEAGVGPPTPGGEAPSSTQRAPAPEEIAAALLFSSHPANQALGGSWLEKQMDLQGKQMLDPAAIAALVRAGVNPESIPGATGRSSLIGAPVVKSPGALAVMSQPEKRGPTEVPYYTNRQTGVDVAPGQPPGPGAPAGGTAPTAPPAPRAPEEVQAGKAVVEHYTDPEKGILPAGMEDVRAFQKTAPLVRTMLQLAENAGLGAGGEWIRQARAFAVRLGISNDEANKISNMETLMKYAIVPASQNTKELTSRPSQLEFLSFMKAAAADPNVNPRTAANVFRGFLVNGLNDVERYEKNLQIAGQIPALQGKLGAYTVPEVSAKTESEGQPISGAERILGENFGDPNAPPIHFERNKMGIWHDLAVIEDSLNKAKAPAGAPSNAPLTKEQEARLLELRKKYGRP